MLSWAGSDQALRSAARTPANLIAQSWPIR